MKTCVWILKTHIKPGIEVCVCNSGAPMVRKEAETGESPETGQPANLNTCSSKPQPKDPGQVRWKVRTAIWGCPLTSVYTPWCLCICMHTHPYLNIVVPHPCQHTYTRACKTKQRKLKYNWSWAVAQWQSVCPASMKPWLPSQLCTASKCFSCSRNKGRSEEVSFGALFSPCLAGKGFFGGEDVGY